MLLIACNLFIGTFDKSAGILNVSLTNKEDSLLLDSDVLKSFTPKLAKFLKSSTIRDNLLSDAYFKFKLVACIVSGSTGRSYAYNIWRIHF